ncbi:hypothetical protein ACOJBO_36875 [Rhizobium beringeri]
MADYNIGSFVAPSLGGDRRDDIVYFADMPDGGEPMCERGPEGLAIILMAIDAQLNKKERRENFAVYKAWLEKLTEAAKEYERILIEIVEDELRVATINHILFRRERAYLQDQEAIANFLYANDKSVSKRTEPDEVLSSGPKR